MKFENTKVTGFENAIIGMRLPMCKDFQDAKSKCDSMKSFELISEKDLDLMKRLIKADENASGQPNSKFLRMIHCQVAITAPLYFMQELDTYKISTVRNSTSKMHTISKYPITQDCFEQPIFEDLLNRLEGLRLKYLETKDKNIWKELIINLPESWLQTSMFDCNYATLRNIYAQRHNHKLTEWHTFCDWVKTLPFADELLIGQ
jgi:hypothetical protein